MQAPVADVASRVIDLLVSPATSIAAIYFYDRFIARKRNGTTNLTGLNQHLDLTLTMHFDQLRRDLESKVRTEHDITRKDWENAFQRFMLSMQLYIATGETPKIDATIDRRRKPRE